MSGPGAPPAARPSDPLVSVVVPVHDEADGLHTFVQRLRAVLDGVGARYEVVLIDDGSRDGSWPLIQRMCADDDRLRGLSLSRNFGKEGALLAGLDAARGDAVVTIDADLQHPPAVIAEMVERWRQGVDVVEAVKRNRTGQGPAARAGGALFNRLFSRLTGVDLTDATDFRLLDRRAVDALRSLPERSMFYRATSTWIGFHRAQVTFDVDPRAAGGSRWSLRSLTRFAVTNLTTFTAAPLHLVTMAGLAFALFSAVLGVQTLWRWIDGQAIEGFTTVILLLLLQGTFVLLGLGVIGEYLARIHDEVKGRPRFLIADRTAPRDRWDAAGSGELAGRDTDTDPPPGAG
jgi:polyisoprenyl-phosphate glycosyltransferase